MMELRWLEYFVQMGDGYGRMDKRLQYRTWNDNTPRTPWQDVPTVSSDAAHEPQEKK